MKVYRGTGDKYPEVDRDARKASHSSHSPCRTPPLTTLKYKLERIPQSRYHVGCDKNNSTHAWD
jgi:hypothetical protein